MLYKYHVFFSKEKDKHCVGVVVVVMVFNQQAFIIYCTKARHCAKSFTVYEKMIHTNPYLFREIRHVQKSFNKMLKMTASMRTEDCHIQGGEEGGSDSTQKRLWSCC